MKDQTPQGDERPQRIDAGSVMIALMGLLMVAQAVWVVGV